MILEYGVTGFWKAGLPAPPEEDGKKFSSWCYATAAELNGYVIRLEEMQYPRNYHTCTLQFGNEMVVILLNAHYPLIAFASEEPTDDQISFMDNEMLRSRFAIDYRVLVTEELNETIACKKTSNQSDNQYELSIPNHLSAIEKKMICLKSNRYGELLTVGNVVYNCWD